MTLGLIVLALVVASIFVMFWLERRRTSKVTPTIEPSISREDLVRSAADAHDAEASVLITQPRVVPAFRFREGEKLVYIDRATLGYETGRDKHETLSSGAVYTSKESRSEKGVLSVTNQRVVFLGDTSNSLEFPIDTVLRITSDHSWNNSYSPDAHKYIHGIGGDLHVRFDRGNALQAERYAIPNLTYFERSLELAGLAMEKTSNFGTTSRS